MWLCGVDRRSSQRNPRLATWGRSFHLDYTTDAIGSVRSVTKQVNGEWTVVTRHDFMPFGEEVAPPPPPSDKRLFTGKGVAAADDRA